MPYAYSNNKDEIEDQIDQINSEIKGENLLEKFDENKEYPKEFEEDQLDNFEVSSLSKISILSMKNTKILR